MPSERSMPSEITGEKAARTKARSISLQTWIRPFWMTVRVTGSRFDAGSDMALCLSQFGVAFQQALDDRAVEDLVGAVGDIDDAKAVPGMVQAELVGEAHGAVGLHGPVDGAVADLHGIGLGHGELFHRR